MSVCMCGCMSVCRYRSEKVRSMYLCKMKGGDIYVVISRISTKKLRKTDFSILLNLNCKYPHVLWLDFVILVSPRNLKKNV